MKAYPIFIILFATAVTALSLHAEDRYLSMITHDKCIQGKVVEDVEGRGLVQIHEATVLGEVFVKGGLEAYHADMNHVGINGRAYLDHSIVHHNITVKGKAVFRDSLVEGNTAIRGTLEAFNTEFGGFIQTASSMVELTNSKAPGIYVYAYGEPQDIQVVKLSKGTLIKGNIVFKCGGGRILMDQDSAIKGDIIGACIVDPGDGGYH